MFLTARSAICSFLKKKNKLKVPFLLQAFPPPPPPFFFNSTSRSTVRGILFWHEVANSSKLLFFHFLPSQYVRLVDGRFDNNLAQCRVKCPFLIKSKIDWPFMHFGGKK